MTESAPLPPPAWDDLEAFVSAMEKLSYSDVGRASFFVRITEGLNQQIGASRILISLYDAGGVELLGGTVVPPEFEISTPDSSVFTPGETRVETVPTGDGRLFLVLDHRFQLHEVLRFTIQTTREGGVSAQSLRDLVGACAVVAGNFLIRSASRELHRRLTARERVAEMIARLAAAEQTAESYAEVCRVIQSALQVDRVSFLRSNQSGTRLLGTSASSTIAGRTNVVRLLELVASESLRAGLRLDLTIGQSGESSHSRFGPSIDEYVDESGVRRLRLIPVPSDASSAGGPSGCVVVEHFSADWPDERQEMVFELAEPHFLASLRRVLHRTLATPLARLKFWWSDRRNWLTAMGVAAVVMPLLLVTVPLELEIPVDGELMPAQRAAIFAPRPGIVDELAVRHGESVAAGALLIELRSPELELEERRISGEMATLQSRLASLKAARIRNRATGSRQESETDLSAEESDLEAQLNGLTTQLALVVKQKETLQVKSPLAGQVDRWDLNQSLADRPVTHGQYLCDVLNVDGSWAIELQIPDDVVGYVLRAQKQHPCPVKYLFRTDSEHQFASQIEAISNSVQIDHDGHPVVLARVPVEPDGKSQFRVGASVLARIQCGRYSIGFVWFREVIEFLQRTLWF